MATTVAQKTKNVPEKALRKIEAGTHYKDKSGKQKKLSAEASIATGSSLEEATEIHGEPVVFAAYRRGLAREAKTALRRELRDLLEDEDTAVDDIPRLASERMKSWSPAKPDKKLRRKIRTIQRLYDSLPEEEHAAVLKILRGR